MLHLPPQPLLSHPLGLESMSQDLLWGAAGGDQHNTSCGGRADTTSLLFSSHNGDTLLPSSQELRLDFRGLTDAHKSLDGESGLQLPTLSSTCDVGTLPLLFFSNFDIS